MYAPIYPQLTIPAINTPGGVTPEGAAKAYIGVVSAFEEYLARYNKGRGFELIGHSQGSAMLEQLIKEQIDPNPTLRKQLVGAIMLGGNVIVPEGKNVGGSFKNVPGCQFAGETGCVIAYSSFLKEPPNPSLFGRPESPLGALGGGAEGVEHPQVLCVNPTLPVQAPLAGPALSYYPTLNAYGGKFPGLLGAVVQAPKASTPWVAAPAEYSAQVRSSQRGQLAAAEPQQRKRLARTHPRNARATVGHPPGRRERRTGQPRARRRPAGGGLPADPPLVTHVRIAALARR